MTLMFYILAAVVLVSAVMVVSRRSAVHSALWLVFTFFGVAGLFILQRAEFIAAVQILVYAGGIMVLFLFVIMLVNIERVEGFVQPRLRILAALSLSALATLTVGTVVGLSGPRGDVPVADGGLAAISRASAIKPEAAAGNLESVGTILMTDYLLAFELVSVVLLVAIVGAILLCRREV